MFEVGQKVVCIWRKEIDVWGPVNAARTYVGKIYTIRGFDVESAPFYDGAVGLYFEELANAPVLTTVGMHEPSYTSERFRPLVERKTDISIFQSLLAPSRECESVER